MIEIKVNSSRFNTRRLADQDRRILKKHWFSDLEIPEICGQINSEEYPLPTNRIRKQNSENRNASDPKNTKQLLTQKDKIM